MNATLNESHLHPVLVEPATVARPEPKTRRAHEPPFDFTLAGAGAAIILWMALFAGLLYSWFTMGRG